MQALIDAQNTAALPHAAIVLVLSNRKAAHGLVRAASASPPIPTAYLALQPYLKAHPDKGREDYDLEVAQLVLAAHPHVVVLAGWMHVMSASFLDALDDASVPVINVHPALPGQFDGANAIQRGYEAFGRGEVDKLGVMVHRVVAEVDRGEPLVVREVPIDKHDSLETFEERLHAVEWEIIVQATHSVLDQVQPVVV